jgi:hypothetical protein
MNKKVLFLSIILLTLLPTMVLAPLNWANPVQGCSGDLKPTSAGDGDPDRVCTWGDVWDSVNRGENVKTIFAKLGSAVLSLPIEYFVAAGIIAGGAITLAGIAILLWGFVQFTLIPFLGLWMIVYGFMMELRIFRRARKVNIWIPTLVALATLPFHLNYILVRLLFSFMGAWSLIVFGLIFAVGVWRYYIKRRGEWGSQAGLAAAYDESVKGLRMELSHEREMLTELMDQFAEVENPKKRVDLEEKITKTRDRIRSLEDRLEEMRGTMRSA